MLISNLKLWKHENAAYYIPLLRVIPLLASLLCMGSQDMELCGGTLGLVIVLVTALGYMQGAMYDTLTHVFGCRAGLPAKEHERHAGKFFELCLWELSRMDPAFGRGIIALVGTCGIFSNLAIMMLLVSFVEVAFLILELGSVKVTVRVHPRRKRIGSRLNRGRVYAALGQSVLANGWYCGKWRTVGRVWLELGSVVEDKTAWEYDSRLHCGLLVKVLHYVCLTIDDRRTVVPRLATDYKRPTEDEQAELLKKLMLGVLRFDGEYTNKFYGRSCKIVGARQHSTSDFVSDYQDTVYEKIRGNKTLWRFVAFIAAIVALVFTVATIYVVVTDWDSIYESTSQKIAEFGDLGIAYRKYVGEQSVAFDFIIDIAVDKAGVFLEMYVDNLLRPEEYDVDPAFLFGGVQGKIIKGYLDTSQKHVSYLLRGGVFYNSTNNTRTEISKGVVSTYYCNRCVVDVDIELSEPEDLVVKDYISKGVGLICVQDECCMYASRKYTVHDLMSVGFDTSKLYVNDITAHNSFYGRVFPARNYTLNEFAVASREVRNCHGYKNFSPSIRHTVLDYCAGYYDAVTNVKGYAEFYCSSYSDCNISFPDNSVECGLNEDPIDNTDRVFVVDLVLHKCRVVCVTYNSMRDLSDLLRSMNAHYDEYVDRTSAYAAVATCTDSIILLINETCVEGYVYEPFRTHAFGNVFQYTREGVVRSKYLYGHGPDGLLQTVSVSVHYRGGVTHKCKRNNGFSSGSIGRSVDWYANYITHPYTKGHQTPCSVGGVCKFYNVFAENDCVQNAKATGIEATINLLATNNTEFMYTTRMVQAVINGTTLIPTVVKYGLLTDSSYTSGVILQYGSDCHVTSEVRAVDYKTRSLVYLEKLVEFGYNMTLVTLDNLAPGVSNAIDFVSKMFFGCDDICIGVIRESLKDYMVGGDYDGYVMVDVINSHDVPVDIDVHSFSGMRMEFKCFGLLNCFFNRLFSYITKFVTVVAQYIGSWVVTVPEVASRCNKMVTEALRTEDDVVFIATGSVSAIVELCEGFVYPYVQSTSMFVSTSNVLTYDTTGVVVYCIGYPVSSSSLSSFLLNVNNKQAIVVIPEHLYEDSSVYDTPRCRTVDESVCKHNSVVIKNLGDRCTGDPNGDTNSASSHGYYGVTFEPLGTVMQVWNAIFGRPPSYYDVVASEVCIACSLDNPTCVCEDTALMANFEREFANSNGSAIVLSNLPNRFELSLMVRILSGVAYKGFGLRPDTYIAYGHMLLDSDFDTLTAGAPSGTLFVGVFDTHGEAYAFHSCLERIAGSFYFLGITGDSSFNHSDVIEQEHAYCQNRRDLNLPGSSSRQVARTFYNAHGVPHSLSIVTKEFPVALELKLHLEFPDVSFSNYPGLLTPGVSKSVMFGVMGLDIVYKFFDMTADAFYSVCTSIASLFSMSGYDNYYAAFGSREETGFTTLYTITLMLGFLLFILMWVYKSPFWMRVAYFLTLFKGCVYYRSVIMLVQVIMSCTGNPLLMFAIPFTGWYGILYSGVYVICYIACLEFSQSDGYGRGRHILGSDGKWYYQKTCRCGDPMCVYEKHKEVCGYINVNPLMPAVRCWFCFECGHSTTEHFSKASYEYKSSEMYKYVKSLGEAGDIAPQVIRRLNLFAIMLSLGIEPRANNSESGTEYKHRYGGQYTYDDCDDAEDGSDATDDSYDDTAPPEDYPRDPTTCCNSVYLRPSTEGFKTVPLFPDMNCILNEIPRLVEMVSVFTISFVAGSPRSALNAADWKCPNCCNVHTLGLCIAGNSVAELDRFTKYVKSTGYNRINVFGYSRYMSRDSFLVYCKKNLLGVEILTYCENYDQKIVSVDTDVFPKKSKSTAASKPGMNPHVDYFVDGSDEFIKAVRDQIKFPNLDKVVFGGVRPQKTIGIVESRKANPNDVEDTIFVSFAGLSGTKKLSDLTYDHVSKASKYNVEDSKTVARIVSMVGVAGSRRLHGGKFGRGYSITSDRYDADVTISKGQRPDCKHTALSVSRMNYLKAARRGVYRSKCDSYAGLKYGRTFVNRSECKLINLNNLSKLINSNTRVLNLGAAPGGFANYLNKLGAHHDSYTYDGAPILDLRGHGHEVKDLDLLDQYDIMSLQPKQKYDVVLSDACGGSDGTFHKVNYDMAVNALVLANDATELGGGCIIKLFDTSEAYINIIVAATQLYSRCMLFKPATSRDVSSEWYLIGTGFLGCDASVTRQLVECGYFNNLTGGSSESAKAILSSINAEARLIYDELLNGKSYKQKTLEVFIEENGISAMYPIQPSFPLPFHHKSYMMIGEPTDGLIYADRNGKPALAERSSGDFTAWTDRSSVKSDVVSCNRLGVDHIKELLSSGVKVLLSRHSHYNACVAESVLRSKGGLLVSTGGLEKTIFAKTFVEDVPDSRLPKHVCCFTRVKGVDEVPDDSESITYVTYKRVDVDALQAKAKYVHVVRMDRPHNKSNRGSRSGLGRFNFMLICFMAMFTCVSAVGSAGSSMSFLVAIAIL